MDIWTSGQLDIRMASDPLAGERPRRGELDKGLKMNAPIKPHTAAAEIV
jgi:hypothetical protein